MLFLGRLLPGASVDIVFQTVFASIVAASWGYVLRRTVDQSARLLTAFVGNPGLHFTVVAAWYALVAPSPYFVYPFLFVFLPATIPSMLVMYVFFRKRADAWEEIGRCQECGYDLTGNVSGRCPECGTPTPHSLLERKD